MKRAHQTTHKLIWILLVPTLIVLLMWALQGRRSIDQSYPKSEISQPGSVLP